MTVRFAVLGAGRIGQVHAQALAAEPKATLVAVADAMEAAAAALAQAHGCAVRSIDEIERSADVDAVVICTPTDMHADLIEQFARAGKAIFCEKPIDLDIKRVAKCLDVVETTGALLMVGFQRRFDPDFNALSQAIDRGEIGAVEMVALTSRDPAPPPIDYIVRSGGIFRDMTIHDFDVARWMLGEEVETVQAAASVLVNDEIGQAGDYDSVNVILRTASGKQCTINNSRRAVYGYDQRIEVHGSQGMLAAGNVHHNRVTLANGKGYTQAPLQDFFMSRYQQAYALEIAAFIDTLDQKVEPPTTGHDGLMALALAEAAVKSVQTQSVVTVADVLAV